jgi:hypothetical protein
MGLPLVRCASLSGSDEKILLRWWLNKKGAGATQATLLRAVAQRHVRRAVRDVCALIGITRDLPQVRLARRTTPLGSGVRCRAGARECGCDRGRRTSVMACPAGTAPPAVRAHATDADGLLSERECTAGWRCDHRRSTSASRCRTGRTSFLRTLCTYSLLALLLASLTVVALQMIAQLYFPPEHRQALYLPFLLPAAVPLLMALLTEIRSAVRQRRAARAAATQVVQ